MTHDRVSEPDSDGGGGTGPGGGAQDTCYWVELGARRYPVHVIEGDLVGLGTAMASVVDPGPALVVTNPVVARHYLAPTLESLRAAGFAPEAVLVPDGEAHKTIATWTRLCESLLARRPTRHTPIVALGGGVTGDLAGFAAASLLRGLPFVQVPTSLLAMVDSSVGGKTGVNAAGGKNLLGAFHQPVLVYSALATLATLPAAEIRSGLGEAVKHGVLGDVALLEFVERNADAVGRGDPAAMARLVMDSVRIKADIVAKDEREAGLRVLLNLGHTVGHAMESALGHGALRHGECVALGLVAEARWAAASQGGEDGLGDRLEALFSRIGLPVRVPPLSLQLAIDAARGDKKLGRGTLRLGIPVKAGVAVPASVSAGELPHMLRLVPGIMEN